MRARFLQTISLAALVSCQPSSSPRSANTRALSTATDTVPPDTRVARLFAFGTTFGESRAAVRTRLGAPHGLQAKAINYPDWPRLDSVVDFRYEGISFRFLTVKRAGLETGVDPD